MNKPKAISLFSGAGGLDCGFEEAGFDIVWANEFDHDAAETWRANRPESKAMVEGDINDCLDKLPTSERIDIVFGGPPCQGFSVAGKMDPNDARSKLVFSFLDVVEKIKPKVFIMENVKALGLLDKWSAVRKALIDRADRLGYSVDYEVHHTFEYGVPQNRDRVIFVGVRKGMNPSAMVSELRKYKATPPSARDVLLSCGEYGTDDNPQTCTSTVTLAKHPVMRKSPYAGMLVNGAGRPVNLDGLPPTLPASMGGNKTPIVDQKALNDRTETNWFVRYHELLENGKATPEETQVPSWMRRLTIKECAAIQTFPSGYRFTGPRVKQYRQIGNAVPALFASAVAKSVIDAYF